MDQVNFLYFTLIPDISLILIRGRIVIYRKLAGLNQLVISKLNEIYKNDPFTRYIRLSLHGSMCGLGLVNFNNMIGMEVEL